MGEASPSGFAPRSPWRVPTVTPPAPPCTPLSARRAHCPDAPAHDGCGARGARTSAPSSSPPTFQGALHTLMHTASQHKPVARAFSPRRTQQATTRPSRAPATQTRTPARGAARNRRRRASPPLPACILCFAATPRLTEFRNPTCDFLSHARGAEINSGLGASAPFPRGGRPKKAGTQKVAKIEAQKTCKKKYRKTSTYIISIRLRTACTLGGGGGGVSGGSGAGPARGEPAARRAGVVASRMRPASALRAAERRCATGGRHPGARGERSLTARGWPERLLIWAYMMSCVTCREMLRFPCVRLCGMCMRARAARQRPPARPRGNWSRPRRRRGG